MLRFITTALGLNVLVDGKSRLVPKDHKNYTQILDGLRAGDFSVTNLIDEMKRKVADFDGVDFQLNNGELLFRGKPYENKVVTDMVFRMLDKGYKAAPLINCLEKVEANPNPNSVKDFWTFMQNTGLAIADDGDVLAFKYVTKVSEMSDGEKKQRLIDMGAEYTDGYSETFDYTPGTTPGIPRHNVTHSPGTDCGIGLHIGDLSYVRHQRHILAVKFSPADVGSIGSGESRKIRVARFHALHIVNPDHLDDSGYKEPVYSIRDGVMSHSDYQKNHATAPEGYVDHESADHWSR